MKKRLLNSIRIAIKKQYPSYSNDKMDEVMYGIEGIYLTITKTIVIFILAFILKIAKELLFLLITFNFIRMFAFGMHANKSWICLVFSSLLFLGGAFLSKYIVLDKVVLYLLYLIAFILVAAYAPADTVNLPILTKKERKTKKVLSYIFATVTLIVSIIIKDNTLSNILLLNVIIESICISRVAYKITKNEYGYENYLKELKVR